MKQLFYINTGSEDQALKKVLSIRIGQRHCSFAISDKIGDMFFSLAYYTAEEINSDLLAEIFSKHDELHSSFHEVQVCFDHPDSVLVPMQYYNPGTTRTILNTMYGNTTGSSVISEMINEWQLYNVYAVPGDVQEWVSRMFPGYKHRHKHTLGIKMMSPDSSDHLLIDFTTDEFSVIILKENKLLIAQTLSYTTPEDILYYLLKTCNQFSLSRGEVQLFISGMIEKESQLYRELYLYFLNITFREPGWNIPSTEANGYPSHYFTSLNDLARCAS